MAETEEIRIQRMSLVKVPTSSTDLIVDDEDIIKDLLKISKSTSIMTLKMI